MQTSSPERNNGPLPGYYETRRLEFEVPKTEGLLRNANEVIDYAAIEARARQLIESHTPPEKDMSPQEYWDNARTALFEGLTRSGHLSRIEFDGDIEAVHQQVLTRLLNGYDRSLPQHELDRRFHEICEELAVQEMFRKVMNGQAPPDIEITTFSDFPHPMGANANGLGYRLENRKGMIRSTYLTRSADGTYRRVLEQLSRSNSDAYETTMMLHENGVNVARRGELDVDLLGTQVMSLRREASEGVVGLMRRLDMYAGPNMMYGEPQSVESAPYESLRQISEHREHLLQGAVGDLARFEQDLDERLARGEITRSQWGRDYIREVRTAIRAICVIDPSYTRAALGSRVEEAYQRAHDQYVMGDTSGAQTTINSVASMESATVICGYMSETPKHQPNNPAPENTNVKRWLDNSKEWKFVDGKCRISNCPTAGSRTKVGPCEICVLCQSHFDAQRNPVQVYNRQQQHRALTQALAQSKPAANHEIPKRFIKIETQPEIGGATPVYRDTRTGAIGTQADFGLAS